MGERLIGLEASDWAKRGMWMPWREVLPLLAFNLDFDLDCDLPSVVFERGKEPYDRCVCKSCCRSVPSSTESLPEPIRSRRSRRHLGSEGPLKGPVGGTGSSLVGEVASFARSVVGLGGAILSVTVYVGSTRGYKESLYVQTSSAQDSLYYTSALR